MKKIIFALALVLTIGFCANAQFGGKDSFFTDWEDVSNGLDRLDSPTMPGIPNYHGMTDDVNAPLGSGLLVLTVLGAGYAVARKKK